TASGGNGPWSADTATPTAPWAKPSIPAERARAPRAARNRGRAGERAQPPRLQGLAPVAPPGGRARSTVMRAVGVVAVNEPDEALVEACLEAKQAAAAAFDELYRRHT